PLLLDLAFFGHGCWLGHHGINLWFEWSWDRKPLITEKSRHAGNRGIYRASPCWARPFGAIQPENGFRWPFGPKFFA
ncbi:MAG: hypothetical protein CBD74_12575, partial [Saprospirales bacterium TMED214]